MKRSIKGWLARVAFSLVGTSLISFASCASAPSADSVDASGVSLQTALSDLSQSVNPGPIANDPVSVVAFQNIDPAAQQRTVLFANYFADSLLSTLKSDHPQLKIVERSELNKVLQERQFSSEGILTDEKLENLAPFLPARYVMTGQFTVFPRTVQVNARLLDVRTGEVVFSKIEVIRDDDNLVSLLRGAGPSATPLPRPSSGGTNFRPRPAEPVARVAHSDNPGLDYSLAFGGGFSLLGASQTQNVSSYFVTGSLNTQDSSSGWDFFMDISPYLTLRYGERQARDIVTVKADFSATGLVLGSYTLPWDVTTQEFAAELKIPVAVSSSSTLSPLLGLDYLSYKSGHVAGVTTTNYWTDYWSPLYLTAGMDMNFFMGRNFFLRASGVVGVSLNSDLPSSDYASYGLTSNWTTDFMIRGGIYAGLAF